MNTSKHSADAEPGGKLTSHDHLISPELLASALRAKSEVKHLPDVEGHRVLLHRVFDGQKEVVVKELEQDRLTTRMTAIYNGKAEFRFAKDRRVTASLHEGRVQIDSGELFPLERSIIIEMRDAMAFVVAYAEGERLKTEARAAARSPESVSEAVDPS
jgi:hypothetical protein